MMARSLSPMDCPREGIGLATSAMPAANSSRCRCMDSSFLDVVLGVVLLMIEAGMGRSEEIAGAVWPECACTTDPTRETLVSTGERARSELPAEFGLPAERIDREQ